MSILHPTIVMKIVSLTSFYNIFTQNSLWNTILYQCVDRLSYRGVIAQQCWFSPRAQTTSAQRLQSYFLSFYLFIYLCLKSAVFLKEQNHESIVHLTCQLLHLLCIFSTRSGAHFFRQFVSGNGSFQVQKKVSWELLEEREGERMKKGWAELFRSFIDSALRTRWIWCALHLILMTSLLTTFTYMLSLFKDSHLFQPTRQGCFWMNIQTNSRSALMLCIIKAVLMLLYIQL